jgi:hypothetical protein
MIDEVQYEIVPEQVVREIIDNRPKVDAAVGEAYNRPGADTESLCQHWSAANMSEEIGDCLEKVLAVSDAETANYICLCLDYARQLQAWHINRLDHFSSHAMG